MGLKDLFITPIYLVLFTVIAYFIRPYVTNRQTRKYFLPALWVRFGGAIALGIIYQFYYGRGDTFGYFDQATIVYNAILNNPIVGLKLIFTPYVNTSDVFIHASKIYWFNSVPEFTIIRIVAVLGLFTFHSYLGTSLFFAFFAFIGSWLMFKVIIQRFNIPVKWVALSTLFIPSVIFWGSGILKDTITLGALGILFYVCHQIIYRRRISVSLLLVMICSAWLIYLIKIYILLCFIPVVFIWWYLENIQRIRSVVFKVLFIPVLLILFLGLGYFTFDQISSSSDRYNLESIAELAYITSYDIRFYTGKNAGSGYDLGAQDGTWGTLIQLAPKAINVALFRPYLWEVNNPLMLLSAIEALIFLFLTLNIILKMSSKRIKQLRQPMVIMFLIFSIAFAFAVGVSTYNFGSLSRYKIPLLPFYATTIVLVLKTKSQDISNRHLNRS